MSNLSLLLDEMFRCVEKLGYDLTMNLLKKGQYDEIQFTDDRVRSVVEEVSLLTGVPIYEIVQGNGRKNDRKYAIGFCTYYLYMPEFYGLDMQDIQNHLCKETLTLCYKYAKMIKKINPNHVSDKRYYEWKLILDKKFQKIPIKK